MNCPRINTAFLIVAVLAMLSVAAQAQYILPQDTMKPRPESADTTEAVDTSNAVRDTTNAADTTKAAQPAPRKIFVPTTTEEEGGAPSPESVLDQASSWLKRVLFRGSFDASRIGAYASYQLTAWGEGTGSYGPVEAHFTIYYLGSTTWESKDAEWLQAVFTTVDEEPMTIEYDLIVPAGAEVKDVYRVLYRVDHGELKAANFSTSSDQNASLQAEKLDSEGAEDIKLYSGSYQTEKFRGVSATGTETIAFRSAAVPPLDIVRLAYGDEALTLTSVGSDAAPRFDAPAPPGR